MPSLDFTVTLRAIGRGLDMGRPGQTDKFPKVLGEYKLLEGEPATTSRSSVINVSRRSLSAGIDELKLIMATFSHGSSQ